MRVRVLNARQVDTMKLWSVRRGDVELMDFSRERAEPFKVTVFDSGETRVRRAIDIPKGSHCVSGCFWALETTLTSEGLDHGRENLCTWWTSSLFGSEG